MFLRNRKYVIALSSFLVITTCVLAFFFYTYKKRRVLNQKVFTEYINQAREYERVGKFEEAEKYYGFAAEISETPSQTDTLQLSFEGLRYVKNEFHQYARFRREADSLSATPSNPNMIIALRKYRLANEIATKRGFDTTYTSDNINRISFSLNQEMESNFRAALAAASRKDFITAQIHLEKLIELQAPVERIQMIEQKMKK